MRSLPSEPIAVASLKANAEGSDGFSEIQGNSRASAVIDSTGLTDAVDADVPPELQAVKPLKKRASKSESMTPWYAYKVINPHPPVVETTRQRQLGLSIDHLPLRNSNDLASGPIVHVAERLFRLTMHRLGWLTAAAILMLAMKLEVYSSVEADCDAVPAHRVLTQAVRDLYMETQKNGAASLPIAEKARTAICGMDKPQLRQFLVDAISMLETGVGPTDLSVATNLGGGRSRRPWPLWSAAVHPAQAFASHINDARDILQQRLTVDAVSDTDAVITSTGNVAVTILPGMRRSELKSAQQKAVLHSSVIAKSHPLARDREIVTQWLDHLLVEWLAPLSALPLYQLVQVGKIASQRLRVVLHASPRNRILSALTFPRSYLDCDCCPERAGDVSTSMPDSSLCFSILSAETTELKRSMPLASFFATFADILRSNSIVAGPGMSSGSAHKRRRSGETLTAIDTPSSIQLSPAALTTMRSVILKIPEAEKRKHARLGLSSGVFAAPGRTTALSPLVASTLPSVRGVRGSDAESDRVFAADATDGDSRIGEGAALPAARVSSGSNKQLRVRFMYALSELRLLGLARFTRRKGIDHVERCVFVHAW